MTENHIEKARSTAIDSASATHTLTPGQLASVLIERENFDVEKLARLAELQQKWEETQARKAYIQAMTSFRSQCPTISRTRQVDFTTSKGRTHYTHAGLAEMMEQVQALLAQCQLSVSWSVVRNDPQWVEVECVLSHIGGHTERTSLGGPPDMSGNKNALQARASTVSYLERYTLKALLGLVDRDMADDDGAGGAPGSPPPPPPPPPAHSAAVIEGDPRAKMRFAAVCADKAGGKPTKAQLIGWLQQVQGMTAETDIGECADWLEKSGDIIDGQVCQADANTTGTEAPPVDAPEWDGPTEPSPSTVTCKHGHRCMASSLVDTDNPLLDRKRGEIGFCPACRAEGKQVIVAAKQK